jgi:transcriptional regulator with XRE-family HTH domain
MHTIDWYIDAAKARSGIKSERKLSEFLGLKFVAISSYRTGRAFPSDDTMVKLAKMAGVNPDIALLELSVWRNEGPARKAYASILHRLAHAMVIICAISSISPANAQAQPLSKCQMERVDLYIMEYNGLI